MNIILIQTSGQSALVEWQDANGTQRAFVPIDLVKDANVSYDVLQQGIPFGEPWETFQLGTVGAERIAESLRQRGIWTYSDVRQRIQDVKAALQDAYSADLKIILELARTKGG